MRTASSSAPEGTIVLESSERGWPLHFSEKDLYQPNGARWTFIPFSRSIASTVRSIFFPASGEDSEEDR